MLTYKMLLASKSSEILLSAIKKMLRYNSDGTDKVKCFYYSKKVKFPELSIGDIEYYYNLSLIESINRWCNNASNIKSGNIKKKFERYVWIEVRNNFIRDVRLLIGSKTNDKKNEFNKMLRNYLDVSEASNIADDFSVIDTVIVDDLKDYVITELVRINKKRMAKVFTLSLKGFKVKEISLLLGCSIVTVSNDISFISKMLKNI